jgi:hypothetical protein
MKEKRRERERKEKGKSQKADNKERKRRKLHPNKYNILPGRKWFKWGKEFPFLYFCT